MNLKEVAQQIRSELSNIYTVVAIYAPYAISLLNALRIVVSEDVPTAGVNDKEIAINPRYWLSLKDHEKKEVILHEALHLALQHWFRMRDLTNYYKNIVNIETIVNIVADAIVNEIIKTIFGRLSRGSITFEKLKVMFGLDVKTEELAKMSLEEIVDLIVRKAKKIEVNAYVIDRDLLSGEFRGEVVQEGSKDLYGESRSGDEFREKLRDLVAGMYVIMKQIGSEPSGLGREIEKILQAKVPWTTILREAIREAIVGRFVRSWLKVNRRFPGIYPGYKAFNVPNVIALVDTSGSITPQELEQFASELYTIIDGFNAKLNVIFWDANAYGPITIRRKSEFLRKWNEYCKGLGGTVIKPALKKALELMMGNEIVVVLSDAEIYDLVVNRDRETIELLDKIGRKAIKAIFVSSKREIGNVLPSSWKFIKIEV